MNSTDYELDCYFMEMTDEEKIEFINSMITIYNKRVKKQLPLYSIESAKGHTITYFTNYNYLYIIKQLTKAENMLINKYTNIGKKSTISRKLQNRFSKDFNLKYYPEYNMVVGGRKENIPFLMKKIKFLITLKKEYNHDKKLVIEFIKETVKETVGEKWLNEKIPSDSDTNKN